MGTVQKSNDPKRILIINPFGIGDVLFTTPLVRAVRQAFPNSRIGYLCNRRTEAILRDNPNLDELFIYEKDEMVRLWKTSWWWALRCLFELAWGIARGRFDLAIDLSLGERYSFLLAWLRVPRRIGFNYRHRGRFLTASLAIDGYRDKHVVEYYRDLLSFIGIRLVEPSLELRVCAEDRQWANQWLDAHRLRGAIPLIGIVPAGGVSWGIDAPFRRWSFKGFAVVGDALISQRGAQVILFGEATDAVICRSVARAMHRPVMDLSGQTTLGQFVGLLGRLDLVVCNDGGPLHLAVSQGVRTVSVFGPVDPQVYGPYPPAEMRHYVVRHRELPCRPCYHQFRLPPCPYERACLTTIGPDEVLAGCASLLDGCAEVAHG